MLSDGGVVIEAIHELPWSKCYAAIIDRYGVLVDCYLTSEGLFSLCKRIYGVGLIKILSECYMDLIQIIC